MPRRPSRPTRQRELAPIEPPQRESTRVGDPSASEAGSEYECLTEPSSEEDLDPSEAYAPDEEEDPEVADTDGDNSDTSEQLYASGDEDTAMDDSEVQEIAEQIRRLEQDDPDSTDSDLALVEKPPSSSQRLDLVGKGLFNGNAFPPEYYRQGVQNMNEDDFTRKAYANGTVEAITRLRRQWTTYCTDFLSADWKRTMREINFRILFKFMEWCIHQKVDKNGKKKRELGSKGSLVVMWCNFRMLYRLEVGQIINNRISSLKVSNGIATLAKAMNLSTQKRVNRPMTLADLTMQLDCIIRTTEKNFKIGEERILMVLCLLLLAPAGSRIKSVLDMRFRDINIVLARDPNGGPHRLLIRFTLNFTKRYLGEKAVKTFLVPEIIFDPTLLLSPHVILLGILFRHRAFKAPGLNNNPHKLAELDIYDGEYELPLPLREEILDIHVFRRAEQTEMGWQVSGNQPITKNMMIAWVRRIGELVGFEHSTITYSLRYMAGNNLDQTADVSDSLRNQVLDHGANSDTFQKHYLNRHVSFDIWALHRKMDLQQDLVHQGASHGHSVSSRRPTGLTAQQSAALNSHPLIKQLSQQLESVPRLERTEGRREINRVRAALRREKKKEVRREWTVKQAVEDIERKIRGDSFIKLARTRHSKPMNPSQERLVAALTAPIIIDLEAQFERRAAAVDAIVEYCSIEEPPTTKVTEAREPPPPPELRLTDEDRIRQWRSSVCISVPHEKLKRCFICVGKAISLPADDHNINTYCREFFSTAEAVRHFRHTHLKKVLPNAQTVCPVCVPVVVLLDREHLQNHAYTVHGLKT